MYRKWLDVLDKCLLFCNIQTGELNTMLECMKPKILEYRKNEIITLEGEHFEGIGIVLKGNASVAKENAEGNRIIMAMLNPSDIFGEIAAFAKVRVWPATVIAQSSCTIMLLPSEKITGNCEKLCASHNLLINNMLGIISDKALMLNKKVECLTAKSLRSKISGLLLEEYKKSGSTTFIMSMNRNELADFLNVSRPSLSREMCRMRDEGIIDFHRSSIQIHDIKSLMHMAE